MQNTTVSIHPYFTVPKENLAAFKALTERFIERAKSEKGCLYYDFSLCGNTYFCREGYANGEAALAHISNVGDLVEEALNISELTRAEIHGIPSEIEMLKEPLANSPFQFFAIESGISNE